MLLTYQNSTLHIHLFFISTVFHLFPFNFVYYILCSCQFIELFLAVLNLTFPDFIFSKLDMASNIHIQLYYTLTFLVFSYDLAFVLIKYTEKFLSSHFLFSQSCKPFIICGIELFIFSIHCNYRINFCSCINISILLR